jgi:DNA uptake protein ComE-like DNA-binding protein
LNRFLFFSRGQQIGIVVLLVLIVAVVVLNVLLPRIFAPSHDANENDSAFVAQVAEFEQQLRDKPKPVWQSPFEARHNDFRTDFEKTIVLQPFDFDPNTLDSAEFVRMGFRPRDVQRIMSFRRKGKMFRTAEFFANDFCKLPPEEAEKLLPHVKIAVAETAKTDTTAQRRPRKEFVYLDLNVADTTALQRMPGIGSGRAKQIVNYRRSLGGYVRTEQLLEINNFPKDVYEQMKSYLSVNQDSVKRIMVNKASVERLKDHPYLNFYQAKLIYDLRRTKGSLHGIDELLPLKNQKEFNGYDFEKLAPYLDFSEIKYQYKR